MTRYNGEKVKLSPGNWIAIVCFLILQFLGVVGYVMRVESRLTRIEVRLDYVAPDPPKRGASVERGEAQARLTPPPQ